MRDACEAAGAEFEGRLQATAAAFAYRSPALLDLMYAAKPGSGAPVPKAAAADAISVVRRLIDDGIATGVLADRDRQWYAFLLFSWFRGIAVLVTSGIVGPDAIDELVADAATTFIRGSAPA